MRIFGYHPSDIDVPHLLENVPKGLFVPSLGLNMKDNDGISKVGRVGEAAVGNIFKSRVATPHGFQFEGFISCIRKGVAESNLHEVVVKLGSSQMGERIVGVAEDPRVISHIYI